MKVLVTGANGFVGRALCKRLIRDGWQVQGAVHRSDGLKELPPGVQGLAVGDIGPHTDWSEALKGVEAVVHLAARVHIMHDMTKNPLLEYRRVSTEGTIRLAQMAVRAGVKRFVYISSVKVHGEETEKIPFREADAPLPKDPYAVSKWEAEQSLQTIAKDTGLEVVIVRPPLVYGPGVRANFLQFMKIVDRGIPLPLRNIENKRSMIYLGNLTDAIVACLVHPSAAGQVFLVSDSETVSTAELVTRIASAFKKQPRLFSVPKSLLTAVGDIFKKRAVVERLVGSLAIDSTKIRDTLNWKPPFSLHEGLRLTVQWYAKNKTTI